MTRSESVLARVELRLRLRLLELGRIDLRLLRRRHQSVVDVVGVQLRNQRVRAARRDVSIFH